MPSHTLNLMAVSRQRIALQKMLWTSYRTGTPANAFSLVLHNIGKRALVTLHKLFATDRIKVAAFMRSDDMKCYRVIVFGVSLSDLASA
jgi:hypothetical protein